jgi:hypothetical protein
MSGFDSSNKRELWESVMDLAEVVILIADSLKEFDSSRPVCKTPKRMFQPGIGPFGEPLLIKRLQGLLTDKGYPATTHRTPDLMIRDEWAVEFKIVRPFGDNGKEAENWSVNLLHPYRGNISAIGDAYKLLDYQKAARKAVFVVGYEHDPAKIPLDPLLRSFEVIAESVCKLPLGKRVEEKRASLVHPVHQVLRCIAWEVASNP